MPVEQVINIQKETGIFIRLIGEVQVSEELALERFIRAVITNPLTKIIELKGREQFPYSVANPSIDLPFTIVVMPVAKYPILIPLLFLRMSIRKPHMIR